MENFYDEGSFPGKTFCGEKFSKGLHRKPSMLLLDGLLGLFRGVDGIAKSNHSYS